MRRAWLYVFCYGVAVLFGYSTIVHSDPPPLHGYSTVRRLPAGPPEPMTSARNAQIAAAGAVVPIPMWTYTQTAGSDLGVAAPFQGLVVGTSPLSKTKSSTTVNVVIIPLIITINDGTTTVVYDPTQADPCLNPTTFTEVKTVTESPIFQNAQWTMNGVNVGFTQYIDAHQRAQFWSLVQGTNYHVLLNPIPGPSQSLNFGPTNANVNPGTNYPANSVGGTCGNIGVVDINDMDTIVVNLIRGPLASIVNVGNFPIFLTKNVVMAVGGASINNNCCVLGYHSSFNVGGNLQIYSPFSFDSSGTFGLSDVRTLAHEMGEAIDDPDGNNLTPVWGNIGQTVGQNGGQNNLENGDPLSVGFGTPTLTWQVKGANGYDYHLQELAYFGWFFGNPALGAGKVFSNNGSLKGDMIVFPPGGSN